jgi:hypothetical protein
MVGGLLAGVGFVAAKAGSLDFIQLELQNLAAQVSGDKPIVVQASLDGRHRSYSTASGGGQQGGMLGAARGVSASGPDGELSFKTSAAQANGGAMLDGGLFDLSSTAIPIRLAAVQDAMWSGNRLHPLADGFSPGTGRPAYGVGGRQRTQNELGECCSPTEAQEDDTLFAAPVLDAAISGPVPELGAWILMILGWGLSGLVLRGQRRVLA